MFGIVAVQHPSEFHQIIADVMRRQGLCGALGHIFKPIKEMQESQIFRLGKGSQQRQIRLFGQRQPRLGGLPQHGPYTGMGVLDIINRVVHGTLLHQGEVEIKMAVALAGQEHESRGVHAHFLDPARVDMATCVPFSSRFTSWMSTTSRSSAFRPTA